MFRRQGFKTVAPLGHGHVLMRKTRQQIANAARQARDRE